MVESADIMRGYRFPCHGLQTAQYDKAHELWTKGERLIEITTTKGYQLTIDYFPSIQVFICSNGYYELSAADIETLSQLLQITD